MTADSLHAAFDFDSDACYNALAVDANGVVNLGLDPCNQTPNPATNCQGQDYIQHNNVYVRQRCNSGWCGIVYAYYFEVDAVSGDKGNCYGHRHDWEHVVVWTERDEIRYVSVSQHGGWERREKKDVLFDNNGHPKIVYHKGYRTTHSMRFATNDDTTAENVSGDWFRGTLVDYYGFPSDALRRAVTDTNWGEKPTPDIRDNIWPSVLKASLQGTKINVFDFNLDAAGTTVGPC